MKHFYFILTVIFATSWQMATATETEPNNTSAQANSLALNVGNNGKISPAGDIDWWKITTTQDGRLSITLTNASGKTFSLALYDFNATTLITSANSANSTFTKNKDGLAAGTYFIKVQCVSAADTASYAINASLEAPGQANDAEPNNSKTTAALLTLNSTQTGHVGYYYNLKRDTADWYKVTTSKNGRLDLSLTPVNSINTKVSLYDNDGSTLLNSQNGTTAFTLSTDGLGRGTFYVKITCITNSDFTPYILANSAVAPAEASDSEPNSTPALASTLTINSTKTGQVGYYYNHKRDTADWFKVSTANDGKLSLSVTPVNGAAITASIYDNNGSTLVKSQASGSAFIFSADGLATGTYYIKINCSNNAQFTPYTLKNTLSTPAQANDAEPNNTKTEAIILKLDSAQTGHVGYYYNNKRDTADWYKVSTNKDGRLDLKLTPLNGVDVIMYLYDNNGTTLLSSKDSTGTFTVSKDGLATGTYYVKVVCGTASQFTAYTLSDSLVVASLNNDVEPNNNKTQAITLNLNSSKNGHVGYYYNNKRDTSDWYKITTKVDTKLSLKLSLTNGQSVTVSLYASNGTSLINSSGDNKNFTLTTDGLEDDIYYVKISCTSTGGYAPYTLANTVTAPPTTDTLILPLNYRITDTLQTQGDVDWYKVTTNADGILNFKLTPLAGKFVWIYLYDHNATTLLNSSYSNAPFVQSTDGLAAGTYYVKVNAYYSTDTTRYLLADTLTTIAQGTDVEPNNSKAQALTLNLNSTKSGHVGYYYNNKRDTADWYKITTNSDGLLNLTLSIANNKNVWVYLYDNDGTTLLNSAYSITGFTLPTDGLAAGTYYVKVNCYYNNEFAPYTLSNTLLTPAQVNDAEPNNTKAQAQTLKLNGTTTGHSGYYYNVKRDTADWYKLTTTAEGQLNFTLTPANGNNLWVYLFDNDGTTLLKSAYSVNAFTLSEDGLAAGTYYVRVNCYYNNQFTPYTLSNTLIKPTQANDAEPNNNRAQALSLSINTPTTGHVGYYYNNKRDTADWYKIVIAKDGMIKLNLTPATNINLWAYLYDNNGTTLLNSAYSTNAFSFNTDGLAAGTYYVRINCYYNSQFTPYTLTDSLFTYSNANDAEPNKYAATANNVSPNTTVTGHVNFYYKLEKDSEDWWKLNYTGNGNLQFVYNLQPNKNGTIPLSWFYVYKDTLASPVYSNYFNAASSSINLSSLAKATYYIKIKTYYGSDFVSYSFSNTFAPAALMMANASSGAISESREAFDNVSVYPNPVANALHIQLNHRPSTGKSANLSSIILRDVNGKQVWNKSNLTNISSGGSLELNVKKYPAGSYFLQMIDVNGNTSIKKIVIVK